jgi:hypothetical protein
LQISPVGRQPVGGWQMKTPVVAYGRQDLLQHSPPHFGRSPSPVVGFGQTLPAGVQPPAPGASTRPQTPSVAPAALVQVPPQQSRSAAQASPFWTQNDGAAEQNPPVQYVEQHSVPAVHGLPDVLHVVLSGVQVPPVHFAPQHCASDVQAALSARHWSFEHLPPAHVNVQHWVPVVHAAPGSPHARPPCEHTFAVASHSFVQHSPSAAHAVPSSLHSLRAVPVFGLSFGSVPAFPLLPPSPAAPSAPPSEVGTDSVSLPQPAEKR